MRAIPSWLAAGLFLGLAVGLAGASDGGPPRVEAVALPAGWIQPQVAVDRDGVAHLLAFRGDPPAGDLVHAAIRPGTSAISGPTRVNANPSSAIALGTIRGGQIAIGRDGIIHVAWNGSNKATPKNPFGSNPMLYSRSLDGGKSFEPERNLMTRTSALDGGGCLAADDRGNVFVAWHARTEDSAEGEDGRRVWLARSRDDGKTFAPEVAVDDGTTGACGCCGMKALADREGRVNLLFRSATKATARDLYLLRSADRGEHFAATMLHPWRLKTCPMASASIIEGESGIYAAWETDQQVYFARLQPDGTAPGPVAPAGGAKGRKHPSLALNDRGQVLLAWTEGTGWQRGGDLVWQVFGADGKPLGKMERLGKGIPAWGLPATVARPDGSFLVLH